MPRLLSLRPAALLALGNLTGARQVLAAAAGTEAASRPGFQLAEGQVELALGEQQAAEASFKQLLLAHPLSAEAQTARAKLTELGAETLLTTADLRSLADAYLNAGRYDLAAEQFRVLAARAGARCRDAQRICGLRGRLPTEVEAAHGRGGPVRCPTRRTKTEPTASICCWSWPGIAMTPPI